MDTSRLKAGWIAAAGLTVLSSAAVAALTLTTAGTTAALPAAVAMVADPVESGRVVASYRTAPAPVTISFRAPAAPAAPVAAGSPAAAAPAPRFAAARLASTQCEGAGWEARRGAAAIDRLRRPSDARAVPVAFRAARSDVLGMADLNARRIDVYVRSCARQSDALLLHVVAHELGHLVDAIRMNDDLRARWLAARGIPTGTPWFGCSRCSDFATPAGDFAETYAQWQRGASTNRSQLAPAPSTAQLASLARTFFAPL